jgi:hypothetical protein
MYERPVPRALSITGLAVQSALFILVGITWVWRYSITASNVSDWYEFVGFMAVDNILFGLVQAVLFVFASRRPRGDGERGESSETDPLLSS